jgi:hypothetical protein
LGADRCQRVRRKARRENRDRLSRGRWRRDMGREPCASAHTSGVCVLWPGRSYLRRTDRPPAAAVTARCNTLRRDAKKVSSAHTLECRFTVCITVLHTGMKGF